MKSFYQSSILYLLLKRYEKSNAFKGNVAAVQRVQFKMNTLKDPLSKDYSDEMDYRKKETIHEAAVELQELKIIEIKWQKFKEGKEIEKIYLQPDSIEAAYHHAGITPRKKLLENAREQIRPLANHPWDWVKAFWKYYNEALKNYQTKGMLVEDPKGLEDLVQTLLYLPTTEDGIMKRVLSHHLFNDTKHFERNVQGKLIAALKRFSELELDTDRELLDSVGIVENPSITLLTGPLVIESKGNTIDFSNFHGGIGIFFETIQDMVIKGLAADSILLIENLTAYHLYLQQRLMEKVPDVLRNTEKVLVIYTGGFPHHALRKLLIKLRDFQIQSPYLSCKVFHWGDIDYGGIMIFEHIKETYFPEISPVLMDVATYEKYMKEGVPFSKDYKVKLVSMSSNKKYEMWWPVIQKLLDKERILEQEGIVIE